VADKPSEQGAWPSSANDYLRGTVDVAKANNVVLPSELIFFLKEKSMAVFKSSIGRMFNSLV
jgi:hypothetical protein